MRLPDVRNFGSHEANYRTPDIYSLQHGVGERSVTVPSDEALCLCTCLKLDQNPVLRNDGRTSRMAAFWSELARHGHIIPRKIIFFHGARLPIPGFRWAPASLLGVHRLTDFDPAAIDSNGLTAEFAAIDCSFSHTPLQADESMLEQALGDMCDRWYVKLSTGD